MIKPEDLRIGDIVRVGKKFGCAIPPNTICKVTGIDSERFFEEKKLRGCVTLVELETQYYNIPYGIWCNYIDPILLTPEILKKNGWENTEYTPLIYTHNEHGIEFWASFKGIENGGTVTYHDEELLDIKYVHELQHILWALGLNANLKI